MLALALAQAAGERGFDGAKPLTSPSGLSGVFWTGLFLLLGSGLGAWVRERRARTGLD